MNRYTFSHYEIVSDKIKKPITIALISDLHGKVYREDNKYLVRDILAQEPDIVLGAGDLYTSNKNGRADSALSLLEKLSVRVPVILADGNHESKTKKAPEYFENRYEKYREAIDDMSDKGKSVTYIVNETVFIDGPQLSVSGLTIGQEYFRHFKMVPMDEDYMEEAISSIPEDTFRILLAHNPLYFREYAAWGADLVLSGHLHGGVVRLPKIGGMFSPDYSMFPKYDGGLFEEYGSKMIVSRGLGMHTIPIRFLNPADVPVIRLIPSEAGKSLL